MKKATLLLADDSVTIQRVIELTFANEDIRVVAVSDGAQAVRWIDLERPDIVLADVSMPQVDGYGVSSHVKQSSSLRSIPVLLLTGAFEPVDEERAKASGCDGVLVKPFEPKQLVTRVKESERHFGGTWTIAIAPVEGGSTLTITEDGWVANPVFRFISRYIIGQTATMDGLIKNVKKELT